MKPWSSWIEAAPAGERAATAGGGLGGAEGTGGRHGEDPRRGVARTAWRRASRMARTIPCLSFPPNLSPVWPIIDDMQRLRVRWILHGCGGCG